ncbi:hypothetical protein HDU91_000770, partial [Kappamyces sp. JEL0680]
ANSHAPASTLYSQPFVSSKALISAYTKFLDLVQTELKASVEKLRQYLGDKNTQLTLIRIIRGSILSQVVEYLGLVKSSPYFPIAEIPEETAIAGKVDGLFEDALQISGSAIRISRASSTSKHPLFQSVLKTLFSRFLAKGWILALPPQSRIPNDPSFFDGNFISQHLLHENESGFHDLTGNPFTAGVAKQHLVHLGETQVYRCFELTDPVAALDWEPSLDQILQPLVGGQQISTRISERIATFNEIIVELQVPEIIEDIQKLLADCHYLVSTLRESDMLQSMKQQGVPSWDDLYMLIEKTVMNKTYDMVYWKICQANKSQDRFLSELMDQAQHAGLYGGSVRLDQSLACHIFKKIEVVRTPMEKIQCLVDAMEALTKHEGKEISGDELLPVIISCVIRSRVLNLASNIDYINNFSFETQVDMGKIGYIISTFEAVLAFMLQPSSQIVENSLFHACFGSLLQSGDFEAVVAFLEQEPRPKFVDENISTFCDKFGNDAVAKCLQHPRLVSHFIQRLGYSVNGRNGLGQTYLQLCAIHNHIDTARELVKLGSDLFLTCRRQETAFVSALLTDHIEMARMLLEENPQLALHMPSYSFFHELKSLDALALLHKIGFDLNLYVANKTLLSHFCYRRLVEPAIFLIQNCTSIDYLNQDYYGRTFLHYCSMNKGNTRIAAAWIASAPAHVVQTVFCTGDIHNNSPLHVAAISRNEDMVSLLLENGADADALNCKDLSPYDLADADQMKPVLLLHRLLQSRDKAPFVAVLAAGKHESQDLFFEVQTSRTSSLDDVVVVRRSLEDFGVLRTMLLIESPQAIM